MNDYQIALTNVNFDDTYNNVLLFDSRQIQEAYFKVNTLFENAPKCNFKASTLLNTSLTYEADPNIDLANILMSNYAIVKQPNGKYLYYFVMNAFQVCDNLIRLDLELDVCQTFLTDLTFSDAVIKRYHINRFLPSYESGKVCFNLKSDSDLLINEPINPKAQRFIDEKKVYSKFATTLDINDSYTRFFDTNILGFEYIFCVANQKYNLEKASGESVEVTINNSVYTHSDLDSGKDIESSVAIFCVPIYKKNSQNKIYFQVGTNFVEWSDLAYKYFMNKNNGASYIYSTKMSARQPFTQFNALTESNFGEINSNGDLIIPTTSGDGNFYFCKGQERVYFSSGYALVNIQREYLSDRNTLISVWGDSYFKVNFNIADIKNSAHSIDFNPKKLANQVCTLKLSNINGSKKEYEPLKLGAHFIRNEKDYYDISPLNVLWHEPLVPDITKQNLAITGTLYTGAYNYDGLIDTFDNTLMLSQDQLALFMANNKNFMQQKVVENVGRGLKGISSGFVNYVEGNYGGAITSVLNSTVDIFQDVINTSYVLDNLENAPDTLKNANGNVIINILATNDNLNPRLELYQALPTDLQSFDDFTNQFGYAYGKLGNINNAMRVRKYFNYVQAEVQEVYSDKLNISNEVHNKIKQIFKNGVRLWNVESGDQVVTFDVNEHENYERWLDNEQ